MKQNKITIEDIARTLDCTGLQFMATTGLDGKPKVRPVQFMVVHGGKLWFCTNSKKAMYAEMQSSPFVELCGSRLEENEIATTWIRFSAEVEFPADDDETLEIKKAIFEKSAIVKELYKNDISSPIFKVFYLKNIKGSMNNLGHVKGLEERADLGGSVTEFQL